jgi:hypothetical protein
VTVNRDARSRRVAVVSDDLLDGLIDELGRSQYGIIQLPPTGLDQETRAAWMEQVAEHVFEFVRNDYEVVLADDGSDGAALSAALAALGAAPIPQYAIQPPSTSRLTPDT